MIALILPGWEERHSSSVFQKYAMMPEELIAEVAPEIISLFHSCKDSQDLRNGKEFVLSFQNRAGTSDYQIVIGKMSTYSATFPEFFKLARRSMFCISLVLENCPLHGFPEKVALLFEPELPKLEFLDNKALHEIMNRDGSHIPALRDKIILTAFYSTGLPLDQIISLRAGDLNLKRGTVST